MIRKELRKLNRRELIEIIYQMKKNEQKMQEEIAALQTQLQEKRLRLSEAGSIAEAAVSVTNVFSAAQAAADMYLQEIACMKEEAKMQCTKRIADTDRTVTQILSNVEQRYHHLLTPGQSAQLKRLRAEVNASAVQEKRKLEEDTDHES
jgi:multidrug efflux pump subunit AcrA (membrane-fusion protein)